MNFKDMMTWINLGENKSLRIQIYTSSVRENPAVEFLKTTPRNPRQRRIQRQRKFLSLKKLVIIQQRNIFLLKTNALQFDDIFEKNVLQNLQYFKHKSIFLWNNNALQFDDILRLVELVELVVFQAQQLVIFNDQKLFLWKINALQFDDTFEVEKS